MIAIACKIPLLAALVLACGDGSESGQPTSSADSEAPSPSAAASEPGAAAERIELDASRAEDRAAWFAQRGRLASCENLHVGLLYSFGSAEFRPIPQPGNCQIEIEIRGELGEEDAPAARYRCSPGAVELQWIVPEGEGVARDAPLGEELLSSGQCAAQAGEPGR
jgi:hypothetical protein